MKFKSRSTARSYAKLRGLWYSDHHRIVHTSYVDNMGLGQRHHCYVLQWKGTGGKQ